MACTLPPANSTGARDTSDAQLAAPAALLRRGSAIDRFAALLQQRTEIAPDPKLPVSVRDLRAYHDTLRLLRDTISAPPPLVTTLHVTPSPEPDTATSLAPLLQSLCPTVFVGQNATDTRMLITLDGSSAAAAVELVREGARLRVRLHARDDRALRLMVSGTDALNDALAAATSLSVHVEVVSASDSHVRAI
ncbi:MAG TPA: hypothetical protein VKB34_06020 [Povalibacter sp.]|nr:hypothetical protein [Povalibacter sp.]